MTKSSIICFLFFMSGFMNAQHQGIDDDKKTLTGVEFHKETLKRLGSAGDNWCITWAEDGSQITSMCDGNWLGLDRSVGYHNHLFRIIGNADSFQRKDIPSYPDFSGETGSWFGYGIISIDGNIYATASKTPKTSWSGPFRGIKLLKSPDNGDNDFDRMIIYIYE